MDIVGRISLNRTLDGKGRVILPGDLRESARFAPDEPVTVTLVSFRDESGESLNGFLITRQCDADPESDDGRQCGWGQRNARKRAETQRNTRRAQDERNGSADDNG